MIQIAENEVPAPGVDHDHAVIHEGINNSKVPKTTATIMPPFQSFTLLSAILSTLKMFPSSPAGSQTALRAVNISTQEIATR